MAFRLEPIPPPGPLNEWEQFCLDFGSDETVFRRKWKQMFNRQPTVLQLDQYRDLRAQLRLEFAHLSEERHA